MPMTVRSKLIEIITAKDDVTRNIPLEEVCQRLSFGEIWNEVSELDRFWRQADNLYERVRAQLFLYAIHRFFLPRFKEVRRYGEIPPEGVIFLQKDRVEEAIDRFLEAQARFGPSETLSSALAAAYYRIAFRTLADQVRRSVHSVAGNRWMFRMGHPQDHAIRIRPELLAAMEDGAYPILWERTPVRMDLTHCGWSDIFFLAMDFPEGARVLNVSIDLGVYGRDFKPTPPVEAFFRVVDEPVVRLVSVDLAEERTITDLSELFDFGRDQLGLLKAAVVASGLVPPGLEGTSHELKFLLEKLCGRGRGFELVTKVNNIPKGSRLAVSTTLLACAISVCMRASGQVQSLEGGLTESERRVVLARALLGEWLGGSGGGWQDSGGIWPGIKLITGALAVPGDPEYGISRGRLLPNHYVLGEAEVPPEARERLQESLVLVHGGMAQNVGPILEMVTERYLLRCGAEWKARLEAISLLGEILEALRRADVRRIGEATTRNFFGPIQTIIPWVTNLYTETLIEEAKRQFGEDFWGFWMLGGMSGGGMGFIFAPDRRAEAMERMLNIMLTTKRRLERALPFAMDPVVYDFAINERGTECTLLAGKEALMPPGYYSVVVPHLIRTERARIPRARRADLDRFAQVCRTCPEWSSVIGKIFEAVFPAAVSEYPHSEQAELAAVLEKWGFDRQVHERIRGEIREGRLGLAQNRLPGTTIIENPSPSELVWLMDDECHNEAAPLAELRAIGEEAIRRGAVGVLTLAAGAGTRWTQGAAVVKGINPFCKIAGKHRSFLEVHISKSKKVAETYQVPPVHIVSTSYLTDQPIRDWLDQSRNWGFDGPVYISPGRSIAQRLIPTVADLKFLWGVRPDVPDELLGGTRYSWLRWVRQVGEAEDYVQNEPYQCVCPGGHWFEVPNMLLNGTLLQILQERPQLQYLLLHNIDAVGVWLDPVLLGQHIRAKATLSFEVIPRRIDDRGGGIAKVDSRLRIVEGLALPSPEVEFRLTYYNTLTTWIEIDKLLKAFGLERDDLKDCEKVRSAVRSFANRLPTYVTIKFIRRRWQQGHEEIHPVAQYEKLWGDMSMLPELVCQYIVVPRMRGAQLKDPAQLDGWFREGGARYVEALGQWS